MSKFIRNKAYLNAVRSTMFSCGFHDEDTEIVARIKQHLDNQVAENNHGFLARVALVVEQKCSCHEAMDCCDENDYYCAMEWHEVDDYFTIQNWFKDAKESGKWTVANHYADAVPVMPYVHPFDLQDHPEVVQEAYINTLNEEDFHKFYSDVDYHLDCAVELGSSPVPPLAKMEEFCVAKTQKLSVSENVPPHDVRYRKLIRDKGMIECGAKMFGDVAYCEYVAKMAIIDRNWCEPYSDDWKFYDRIASVASRVLPLCL